MTPEELQDLIRCDEDIKLDFKREYKLSKNPPVGSDKQQWISFVNGQWDELIKDIIALANGNVGAAGRTGRLIIGVDDQLLLDGTRQLYDMANLNIAEQQVLSKVNKACQPPLPQLLIERVVLEGKTVIVVSIPPSPYVHETTRQLVIMKGNFDSQGHLKSCINEKSYTEYTAFIRKGENISPASWIERRELERDKRFEKVALNENLKSELCHNLGQMIKKLQGKFEDPSYIIDSVIKRYKLECDTTIEVDSHYFFYVTFMFLNASSSKHLSTQFLDDAILSGKYLDLEGTSGSYKDSDFLQYLRELQLAIRRLKILYESFKNQGDKFMTEYNPRNRSSSKIRAQCNDVIPIITIIYRYEDVINLSAALLKYLIAPNKGLAKVVLNPQTAASDEIERLEEENLSSEEIVDWVLNR